MLLKLSTMAKNWCKNCIESLNFYFVLVNTFEVLLPKDLRQNNSDNPWDVFMDSFDVRLEVFILTKALVANIGQIFLKLSMNIFSSVSLSVLFG